MQKLRKIAPRQILVGGLAVAVAAVLGCGSESVRGSCRTGQLDDGSRLCIDYYDRSLAKDFRPLCTTLMRGKWSDGPCDPRGALGGCRTQKDDTVTWIYPSKKHATADDVQEFCDQSGGTFVSVLE
jgi:hypothetical protein